MERGLAERGEVKMVIDDRENRERRTIRRKGCRDEKNINSRKRVRQWRKEGSERKKEDRER